MRNQFREWYLPTEEELDDLWLRGTVVLDANVLLGLYQYPPATLAEFFKALTGVKERLWLPYHAGLEYHTNRDKSLPQQRGILNGLVTRIEELSSSLDRLGIPEHHPTLDLQGMGAGRKEVKETLERLLQRVRDALNNTPEFDADAILRGEPIRNALTELFLGRVGDKLESSELQEIYKEGEERYARSQPPGFKDINKQIPERYGDLVIWKEILKHQKGVEEPRGTLFVTNDRKEDWWLRKNDRLLGPRPELVREYMTEVGGDFFMYTPADFLNNVQVRLSVTISAEAIADVRRISAASPVTEFLRLQRMVLPELPIRIRGLNGIYEAIASGKIQRVSDVNSAIENLGEPFYSNDVETPLFFSLVSPDYGVLAIPSNPMLRLRERPIGLTERASSKDEFISSAHAGWLAQALYRVRNERFSDEELLVGFFGEDYPPEAGPLLEKARGLIARAPV